ncbi:MAG: phosphate signaling complex protein PhoU [Bacteroidaceae bacterium]|nr:phosphate signaling complex protein PhoU [Bacteroidaceae bacterium]
MVYIQQELEKLKSELLEMWDLVNSQLNRAGEALLSLDKEIAKDVMCREKRVNAFELKIDSDCEDIIGLYNPVALDLRFTLSSMKISTNLERIGDFCEGLARFVLDYPEVNIESDLFERTGIKEMITIVKEMLRRTRDAYEQESSALATSIFAMDTRVDELNRAAVPIIAEHLQQVPERAFECLNLISIIRRLERMGDHCNNIAEDVVFYIDAKVLKHADKSSK